MDLSIIITESQKRMILSESFNNDLQDTLKKNYEFVKKIISEAQEQIGVNLEFLMSWGATIGGFIGPINEYIAGRFPELTDVQLSLLATGIISSYYIDNKKTIKKIYQKIMDEGLENVMEVALKKSDDLYVAFIGFIKSLGLTLHKVTNILSYAFIIPILPMLYQIVIDGDMSEKDLLEIAHRISGFGIVAVSGIILRELIFKILKRFGG